MQRDKGKNKIAQQRAVESIANIASVFESAKVPFVSVDPALEGMGAPTDTEAGESGADDAVLANILTILDGADGPVAVADVARQLELDSDTVANALVRGGKSGKLTFLRDGSRTTVVLASG